MSDMLRFLRGIRLVWSGNILGMSSLRGQGVIR